MRQTCIFSGTSHPLLVEGICDRLGQKPAKVDLRKFSNGETSVEIKTSVRDQDVFIVQSGCSEINDAVMEMLIMISACKGGSARSITAVVPYFPYSRQSKKKTHRGAITARMLANLMNVAGVNHVITIDLHAGQMQGFFKCPVDNLIAEPLIARWIKSNVPEWWDGVVVSKNPGGTKRVTSLADALKLSFGIVTTDQRRRPHMPMSMFNSAVLDTMGADAFDDAKSAQGEEAELKIYPETRQPPPAAPEIDLSGLRVSTRQTPPKEHHTHRRQGSGRLRGFSGTNHARFANGNGSEVASSPLAQSTPANHSEDEDQGRRLSRVRTVPGVTSRPADEDGYEEGGEGDDDELARDVITGRLIHGHVVDDDVPSPNLSIASASVHGHRHSSDEDPPPDIMTQSFMSVASSRANVGHGLGGTGDATHSDEEEEEALRNPQIEHTITLVGNVRDKPVMVVDDIMDKAASWIVAAETVVKRGGATKVYCFATHALFGDDCLQELEMCDEIEAIIVTNSFPIPQEKLRASRKLHVLDVSGLLAEAIRRNHHGESISQLYQHFD